MPNGVIIINKQKGLTSQGVVNRVKRLLGVKKAGHTGTLDPMAEGVLPVLIERGVKVSEYMLSSDKHYIATLTLGIVTDTEDTSGEILSQSDNIPNEDEVKRVVKEFIGNIKQTPPMYSALKVGGKKLYELAREGKVIEREARDICVFGIDCQKIDDKNYSLDIRCSKGTYIRTLCNDIGARLGCGGAMASLTRAEASGFTLKDAITLDELEALGEKAKERVLPVSEIFKDNVAVHLPPFFARLAKNGLEISQKKIGTNLSDNTLVRLYDGDVFFALGRVKISDEGSFIKPEKQIEI